jgi:hypothetical protein
MQNAIENLFEFANVVTIDVAHDVDDLAAGSRFVHDRAGQESHGKILSGR